MYITFVRQRCRCFRRQVVREIGKTVLSTHSKNPFLSSCCNDYIHLLRYRRRCFGREVEIVEFVISAQWRAFSTQLCLTLVQESLTRSWGGGLGLFDVGGGAAYRRISVYAKRLLFATPPNATSAFPGTQDRSPPTCTYGM